MCLTDCVEQTDRGTNCVPGAGARVPGGAWVLCSRLAACAGIGGVGRWYHAQSLPGLSLPVCTELCGACGSVSSCEVGVVVSF